MEPAERLAHGRKSRDFWFWSFEIGFSCVLASNEKKRSHVGS